MKEREPLIRLTKRQNMAKSRIWLIRLGALVFAIILGGLVFMIAGANPLTAYGTILSGSLGKVTGIRQVVKFSETVFVKADRSFTKMDKVSFCYKSCCIFMGKKTKFTPSRGSGGSRRVTFRRSG